MFVSFQLSNYKTYNYIFYKHFCSNYYEMLPRNIYYSLKPTLLHSRCFGCCPYMYDIRSNKLLLHPAWKKISWIILLYSIIHKCYLLNRLIDSFRKENDDYLKHIVKGIMNITEFLLTICRLFRTNGIEYMKRLEKCFKNLDKVDKILKIYKQELDYNMPRRKFYLYIIINTMYFFCDVIYMLSYVTSVKDNILDITHILNLILWIIFYNIKISFLQEYLIWHLMLFERLKIINKTLRSNSAPSVIKRVKNLRSFGHCHMLLNSCRKRVNSIYSLYFVLYIATFFFGCNLVGFQIYAVTYTDMPIDKYFIHYCIAVLVFEVLNFIYIICFVYRTDCEVILRIN